MGEALTALVVGLVPFLTIVGLGSYVMAAGLKVQFGDNKVIKRFMPSWPLVFGVILGIGFYWLLPDGPSFGYRIGEGIGYGLVAGGLSSKIYEQFTRRLDTPATPAPIVTIKDTSNDKSSDVH